MRYDFPFFSEHGWYILWYSDLERVEKDSSRLSSVMKDSLSRWAVGDIYKALPQRHSLGMWNAIEIQYSLMTHRIIQERHCNANCPSQQFVFGGLKGTFELISPFTLLLYLLAHSCLLEVQHWISLLCLQGQQNCYHAASSLNTCKIYFRI